MKNMKIICGSDIYLFHLGYNYFSIRCFPITGPFQPKDIFNSHDIRNNPNSIDNATMPEAIRQQAKRFLKLQVFG